MDEKRREYKRKWDSTNKERVKEYNRKYKNHEVGRWIKNKTIDFKPETDQEKRLFDRFRSIFGRYPTTSEELNQLIRWFRNAYKAKTVENKHCLTKI